MPSESHQSPYAGNYPDIVEPSPEYGTPVPSETSAYINFPYRGIQTHGVDPTVVPVPADEDIAGGKVVSNYNAEPEIAVTPVPVRIVDTAAAEFQRWRAYQAFATVNPRLIVNRQENRKKTTIKNLHTADPVWLGPDVSVSSLNGFRLDFGQTFTLDGEAEVYAIRGGANDVALSVAVEYSTPTE